MQIKMILLFVLFSTGAYAQKEEIITNPQKGQAKRTVFSVSPIPSAREQAKASSKSTVKDDLDHADTVLINDVPAFQWTYGSAPTAAGMLIGYYDRNGYPNLYIGEVSSGICPLTDQDWVDRWGTGSPGLVSFIASKKGVDGLETNGHVDDFYNDVNSETDPYYGKWLPHCNPGEGNCLADFMGTSQWYPENLNLRDGASKFDFAFSGNDFYTSTTFGDAAFGIKLFIESKGYNVDFYGNGKLYDSDYPQLNGVTFENFQSEIDAGHPVIINLTNHSMLGIGYNATLNKVFFHDTWDREVHSMDWGGTYMNRKMFAVTVIQLNPPPTATATVEIGCNLDVASGNIAPFGNLNVAADEAVALVAADTSNQRFVRWETTGAVSVADSTASETTFTCTGSGGTINAVYEDLSDLDIKSLKIFVGKPGKDSICLILNNNFPNGITNGKIIIDDYEYSFPDFPANTEVNTEDLCVSNIDFFKIHIKKQTLDLFDTTDGLWVEVVNNGQAIRKELTHLELGVFQTWFSGQETSGTNMTVQSFKAKYKKIRNRDKSFFSGWVKGIDLPEFSHDAPARIELDNDNFTLPAPNDSRKDEFYRAKEVFHRNPRLYNRKLQINSKTNRFHFTIRQRDRLTYRHPEEDAEIVAVTITDGTDTATVDVSCTVKQKITYKQ